MTSSSETASSSAPSVSRVLAPRRWALIAMALSGLRISCATVAESFAHGREAIAPLQGLPGARVFGGERPVVALQPHRAQARTRRRRALRRATAGSQEGLAHDLVEAVEAHADAEAPDDAAAERHGAASSSTGRPSISCRCSRSAVSAGSRPSFSSDSGSDAPCTVRVSP